MTEPEILEALVAGLTKAQRFAIQWPPADGSWSSTRAPWTIANSVIWLERNRPDLAEAKVVGRNGAGNDLRHRLTPLGQKVAAALRARAAL